MRIFAVETSCDETAWCLAELSYNRLNVIHSFSFTQTVHSEYGGIVPELSARQQLEALSSSIDIIQPVVREADIIAVTEGPGLKGSLLIGSVFTATLSLVSSKPCVPVDHVDAHLLSPMINSDLNFPFISAVFSGGHTAICLVESPDRITVLSRTLDDAIGEAFDKCGALLGFDYPSGPKLAAFADRHHGDLIKLPIAIPDDKNFSFSGFKTAVKREIQKLQPLNDEVKAALCASIQNGLVENAIAKLSLVASELPKLPIGVSGGVASNLLLRRRLFETFTDRKVYIPESRLCVDNAEMIAFAAYKKIISGTAQVRLPQIYSRWSRITG